MKYYMVLLLILYARKMSIYVHMIIFEIGVMTVTAVPLCMCAPDVNVEVAFAPVSTGKH